MLFLELATDHPVFPRQAGGIDAKPHTGNAILELKVCGILQAIGGKQSHPIADRSYRESAVQDCGLFNVGERFRNLLGKTADLGSGVLGGGVHAGIVLPRVVSASFLPMGKVKEFYHDR